MVMRETIGFARPRPEDLVREDELRIAPAIELQLSRGFKSAVIERWLRVYGESLRRIAETEADWWHTEIEVPHLASGLDEAEMLEVAARWGDEMPRQPSKPSSASTTRTRNTHGPTFSSQM
jgi:hypothetical protein